MLLTLFHIKSIAVHIKGAGRKGCCRQPIVLGDGTNDQGRHHGGWYGDRGHHDQWQYDDG